MDIGVEKSGVLGFAGAKRLKDLRRKSALMEWKFCKNHPVGWLVDKKTGKWHWESKTFQQKWDEMPKGDWVEFCGVKFVK